VDDVVSITTVKVDAGTALKIDFSDKKQPHILRILAAHKPSGITLDGEVLPEGAAWRFDEKDQRLVITTRAYNQGLYVITWR
jgi:hypothetical protein